MHFTALCNMAGELLVLLIAISVDFSQAGITNDSFGRDSFENDKNFKDPTLRENSIGREILNTSETTMYGGNHPGGDINKENIRSSIEGEQNKMEIASGESVIAPENTNNMNEGSGESAYTVFREESLQISLQPFNGSVSINYTFLKDKPELIQCHVISRRNERFIETLMSLINCGHFPEIPNGKFVFALGNSPDDIIPRVICDRYYIRVGAANGDLRCRNGVWYHNATCEIVKCLRKLQVPSNGRKVSKTGHTVNSTITFSCEYGYELLGNKTLVCGEDGNWTGTFPSCQLVKCPKPLPPDHGFIEEDKQETIFNTTLVYRCMEGYSLVGKSHITCQADGKWNTEIPACKPVCLIPDIRGLAKPLWLLPTFEALSTSAEISYGRQIMYSCKKRFKNAYEGAITCINGIWVPAIFCIRSFACVEPNIPKNAIIVDQIGTVFVQYDCKKGYQISNTDNRICSRRGTWSRPVPECVKSCELPKFFAMKDAEFDFKYNKTKTRSLYEIFLSYSCRNGFRKLKEIQPKCINETWNPTPRCVSINVRLSYSFGETIGVAEIFTDGSWGGVCDHFYSGVGIWGKSESKVLCRMLGFKSGRKLRSYSSSGVRAKFMGIACSGDEENILQCRTKQANVFCTDLVVVSCRGYIFPE
ncbi:sushi, von Willebrand factor type A, EGF and pentraxin domain-containing protein 1 [Octopus bimaculoides]|uniref:Sushi, von Willebrand factor type A, EGF and pentraxin domain-containing protein 1 n=1 Tax=Octopus bimaculoides TaxID=37653 RepID=A0A0L8HE70_OCTBM|nr:sushi, von Willebrand factor type A, EGF and pentraxin domain-containing protein 1 [Octopus bimaculoides]|eukprot:XP_014773468.1 PREDICTED: sushi, von Willebrand factor type A, EGF and pentraxin domain-containing protein 1-like [Octopus bimaculoides]